ncbi:MAG: protein-tyrosine phosphatase family protein [Thermoplasmata archaeon]
MLLYWIEEDRLAGGSCPFPEDLPRLQRRGFDTLVSLLEDPRQCAYDPEEAKTRFQWVNVPMADHRTPDVTQLLAVHERLTADPPPRRILVHCYAGIGRTGLVALSYLMARGLPEAEAARRVDGWTEAPSRGRSRPAERRSGAFSVSSWPAGPPPRKPNIGHDTMQRIGSRHGRRVARSYRRGLGQLSWRGL